MSPFTTYAVRRPLYSQFLDDAVAHVQEHARYLPTPANGQHYAVRYPLASSVCYYADDTHTLARIVAKEMMRRARA